MENLLNFEIEYFVYKKCSPGWRLEHKVFPIYGLVVVLEGKARYQINGREHQVTAGDMVFVRPGSTRSATTTGMICAAFDFNLKHGTLDLPVVSRCTPNEELTRLLEEFQYEWLQKQSGMALKCGALFLQILHLLLYNPDTLATNYHVEKIKRYILEHFTERISVKALAYMTNLSPVYCGALFRKTQGMTIAEYANRIRVYKAAAILEEGGCDITEASLLCGFNDVYYFSNTFKRIIGLSPSAYKSRPARDPSHRGNIDSVC